MGDAARSARRQAEGDGRRRRDGGEELLGKGRGGGGGRSIATPIYPPSCALMWTTRRLEIRGARPPVVAALTCLPFLPNEIPAIRKQERPEEVQTDTRRDHCHKEINDLRSTDAPCTLLHCAVFNICAFIASACIRPLKPPVEPEICASRPGGPPGGGRARGGGERMRQRALRRPSLHDSHAAGPTAAAASTSYPVAARNERTIEAWSPREGKTSGARLGVASPLLGFF